MMPPLSQDSSTNYEVVIYMHIHICYSAMKNKELLLFSIFDNMDGPLEGIMLSEIGRAEKDKYHMISHVCGI